uniref:1-acylglycerol-3-phosphate O-acyltransferase ABHD5 n=1 Tax=Poecilia reticulata TaxID=8081 RepID=A0A3P9PXB4_POERE
KHKQTKPIKTSSNISNWLPSWCPTSPTQLKDAEEKMLKGKQKREKLSFSTHLHPNSSSLLPPRSQPRMPLVLLHGLGGGIGLWIQNLDALSSCGPVYALDLLGFGRSSRPQFSTDPEGAEEDFVSALEEWRQKVGLEEMVLLGHNLGGYLSAAYTLKYPNRSKNLLDETKFHLFGSKLRGNRTMNKSIKSCLNGMVMIWARFGAITSGHSPPSGPMLVKTIRSDFKQKYSAVFNDDTVSDYIYHLNAQTPSGETAFRNMTVPYGWAKRPMLERIDGVRADIPISFIYGSRSSIDSNSGYEVKKTRPDVIRGAGHYVYADQPEDFNHTVLRILAWTEQKSADN